MKTAYRLYRRNRTGVYYIQNNRTRKQHSLGTTDLAQAKKLLDAKNQEQQTPALNLQLGKAYITHADPKMAKRIWQEAMDELSSHGKQSSQSRCARALKSSAFDIIRNQPIALTTSEELKAVLKCGGSATNNYLRRLHNLALGNGWIQWNIIPPASLQLMVGRVTPLRAVPIVGQASRLSGPSGKVTHLPVTLSPARTCEQPGMDGRRPQVKLWEGGTPTLKPMRWGLIPSWSKDETIKRWITIRSLPMWAFARRCSVSGCQLDVF